MTDPRPRPDAPRHLHAHRVAFVAWFIGLVGTVAALLIGDPAGAQAVPYSIAYAFGFVGFLVAGFCSGLILLSPDHRARRDV